MWRSEEVTKTRVTELLLTASNHTTMYGQRKQFAEMIMQTMTFQSLLKRSAVMARNRP
jgi:hypothetical protein